MDTNKTLEVEPTPGPWVVNKYGSIGAGQYGTLPIVAAVEPLEGPDRKYGNHAANARLIAAAPDLLAAPSRGCLRAASSKPERAIHLARAPYIGVHDYARTSCRGVEMAVHDSGLEVVERVDSLVILRRGVR